MKKFDWSNEDIALAIVRRNVMDLLDAPKSLKDNEEFMLKVVRLNVLGLTFATKRLKSDYKFMLMAIYENKNASNYVARALAQDPDFQEDVIAILEEKDEDEVRRAQFKSTISENDYILL